MLSKFTDQEHFWPRPSFEDIKKENNCIFLQYQFPKTIPKDIFITSDDYFTLDLIYEVKALLKLNKPLEIWATSGRWSPFLLKTTDDFEITLEDEKFISNYMNELRFG